jgi:hypothetical protein
MYYLPDKIFLSEFKYFAQSRTLARGGWGEQKVTASLLASTKPHCTGTVNDRNRGQKGLAMLGPIRARYDMLIKN